MAAASAPRCRQYLCRHRGIGGAFRYTRPRSQRLCGGPACGQAPCCSREDVPVCGRCAGAAWSKMLRNPRRAVPRSRPCSPSASHSAGRLCCIRRRRPVTPYQRDERCKRHPSRAVPGTGPGGQHRRCTHPDAAALVERLLSGKMADLGARCRHPDEAGTPVAAEIPERDGLAVARLMFTARRLVAQLGHRAWRWPTPDDGRWVAELQQIAPGRAHLLAEAAGVMLGTARGGHRSPEVIRGCRAVPRSEPSGPGPAVDRGGGGDVRRRFSTARSRE